ncbi:hypothetical protein [Nocardia sp. MW-W600-9]
MRTGQLPVVDTPVVHRDDVRMLQLRRQIGFPLEPRPDLGVGEQLRIQQLERELPG